MSDERRERWESAMRETPLGYAVGDIRVQDAVTNGMAVADEENARLRAELDENTGIMQALRRQRDTAEATIARVEAELPDESERVKYGFPDQIALSNGLFGLADRIRAAMEGEPS